MPTSAAAIESNPMTKALRIVVADDEPVMLDYFQRMLPWLGYEVVAAAANGRELVELCQAKSRINCNTVWRRGFPQVFDSRVFCEDVR